MFGDIGTNGGQWWLLVVVEADGGQCWLVEDVETGDGLRWLLVVDGGC